MRETDTVYNERLKALSGMFHNLAVASVTGGVVLPLIQANAGLDRELTYIITMPIGMILALGFAFLGQIMLKDLREPRPFHTDPAHSRS